MRNKYMRRGLLLVAAGVCLNLLGMTIRERELGLYGWAYILGTILFGVGFIYIIYSLIRKVERKAILEERAADNDRPENLQFKEVTSK